MVLVTAALVYVTLQYVSATKRIVDAMERQGTEMHQQLAAAERQRKAMIRPVLVFRSNFHDLQAVPRYEVELQEWKDEVSRWRTAVNSRAAALPPGPRPGPPKAALANVGHGVALNIRARIANGPGEERFATPASIAVSESHYVEPWYPFLSSGDAAIFLATYEDAEGTSHYSAARYVRRSDGELVEEWVMSEGVPPQGFGAALQYADSAVLVQA